MVKDDNKAGWRWVLPSLSSYPISIYLYVIQHIPVSNGDEKSYHTLISDGFGYPRHIPILAVDNFFNKNKSIFLALSVML